MTIHNEYPLVRLGASEVPPDDLGDGDDTVAIAERGAAARALDRWLVNSVLRDGAVPQGLVGLGWIKNYGDRADSQVIKPLEERLRASVSSATAALDAHGKLCGALDLVGDEVDKEGVKAQIRDVAVRNRLEWMEQQIARTFPENSPVVVRSGNTPWSEEKLGGVHVPSVGKYQQRSGLKRDSAPVSYVTHTQAAKTKALEYVHRLRSVLLPDDGENQLSEEEVAQREMLADEVRTVESAMRGNEEEGGDTPGNVVSETGAVYAELMQAVNDAQWSLVYGKVGSLGGELEDFAHLSEEAARKLASVARRVNKLIPGQGQKALDNYHNKLIEEIRSVIEGESDQLIDKLCGRMMEDVLTELAGSLRNTAVNPEWVATNGLGEGEAVRKARKRRQVSQVSEPARTLPTVAGEGERVVEHPESVTLPSEILDKLGLTDKESTREIRNVVTHGGRSVVVIDAVGAEAAKIRFKTEGDRRYEEGRLNCVAEQIVTAKDDNSILRSLDPVRDTDKSKYGRIIYAAPKEKRHNARRVYFMHMTIDELIDATKKCRDSDTLGELNRMKDQGVLDAIMHVGSCNKKTQRALLHHFTGITDRELKKNGVGDV